MVSAQVRQLESDFFANVTAVLNAIMALAGTATRRRKASLRPAGASDNRAKLRGQTADSARRTYLRLWTLIRVLFLPP